MSRILVHDPDRSIQAFHTQVAEPMKAAKIPIVLDIDAFAHTGLPLDSEKLLARFPPLRDFKNKLFFESLTDDGLKLFT